MKKNPKRVAAGRRSKLKGKAFEQEVVRLLRKAGIPAERNWHQSGAFAKAKKGDEEKPNLPDITIKTIKGSVLWIECSSGARVNPVAKLEQADGDIAGTTKDRSAYIPVVISRRKYQKAILVTMWFEDLCFLVDSASALSGPLVFPVSFALEDFLILLEDHHG